MFTNVKSQMTGWLGSGIPIPGLRKTEAAAEEAGATAEAAEAIQPEASSAQDLAKDEDDNSRYIRYGVIHAMRSLTDNYSFSFGKWFKQESLKISLKSDKKNHNPSKKMGLNKFLVKRCLYLKWSSFFSGFLSHNLSLKFHHLIILISWWNFRLYYLTLFQYSCFYFFP